VHDDEVSDTGPDADGIVHQWNPLDGNVRGVYTLERLSGLLYETYDPAIGSMCWLPTDP